MAVSTDFQHGVCRLLFSGEITARTRTETDGQLIDALRRYEAFELDLSGVEEIDESGVRLMLWFTRIGGRGSLRFTGLSPVVRQALDYLSPARELNT